MEYQLAQHYWQPREVLRIQDRAGRRLLTFPLDLLRGGHVANYTYVLEQLVSTFETEGTPIKDGQPVNVDEPLSGCTLIFERDGEHRVCWFSRLSSEGANERSRIVDGSDEPCTP